MGRMENHPVLSSSLQNRSAASRFISANGVPEAPFLMGYRVQAQFGPLMEFYLNTVNFWGGTRDGRAVTDGYNLKDYATAMLGIKDGLTEASIDYSPGADFPKGGLPQKVTSATEIDVGFRLQAPALARVLGADTAQMYISRGSKSVLWPIAVFFHNPISSTGRDLKSEVTNLLTSPSYGSWWNTTTRYGAPNLNQANDTVGILVSWPGVRAGLEYFACVDMDSGNGAGFLSFHPRHLCARLLLLRRSPGQRGGRGGDHHHGQARG